MIAFNGKSLKEIAENLGENASSFWNWAKERTDMPNRVLAKIANNTDYSLNWILTGQGGKKVKEENEFELFDYQELKRMIRVVSLEVVREEISRQVYIRNVGDHKITNETVIKFNSSARRLLNGVTERLKIMFDESHYECFIPSIQLFQNGNLSFDDLRKTCKDASDSYYNINWFLNGTGKRKIDFKDPKAFENYQQTIKIFWNELIDLNKSQLEMDNNLKKIDEAEFIREIVREELSKKLEKIEENTGTILLDEETIFHPDNLSDETRKALNDFFFKVIYESNSQRANQTLTKAEVPYLGKIGGTPQESDIKIETHKQEKKAG